MRAEDTGSMESGSKGIVRDVIDMRGRFTQLAFRFVLIIGIVNLFADFTYEGARSIN